MKTADCIGKSWMWAAAALQLGLGASAYAEPPSQIPPDPWAPVYARILSSPEQNCVAWVFYRAPEVVPTDFSLPRFTDWKDRNGNGVPDPWEHPLLVEGFQIRNDIWYYKCSLQEIDEVPVWFTSYDEALAVLRSTGTITIEQLSGMTSLLKGSATFYHEELHPVEAAQVFKSSYQAKGTLEDGRTFSLHVSRNWHDNTPEPYNEMFSLEFK